MSFIIPAIDLIDGSCVRLTEGVYDTSKIYSSDPLEIARRFEEAGSRRLHLVDLDGARKGRPCNLDILEKIASGTNLVVDFSGGLRDRDSIQDSFNSGASSVCIGSLAVREPDTFASFIDDFGAENVILSADVRGEFLAVKGWEEQTNVSIYSLIDTILNTSKLEHVIVTDISRDGRLQGPSFELYRELKERFPDVRFIASGGVHSQEDVVRLRVLLLGGVIIGKALYEGIIPYASLGEF